MNNHIAFAQLYSNSDSIQRILSRQFGQLRKAETDSLRKIFNDSIFSGLNSILKIRNPIDQPFDSVSGINTPASPDGKFRFFQWNTQWKDGHHTYQGILCVRERNNQFKLYPLKELTVYMSETDTMVLDPLRWYGALYYKIIPMESASNQLVYTLLGWAGKDNYLTRKVIEVVAFDSAGLPKFGKAIFDCYKKPAGKRIVFQYSAGTTMTLKFENQVVSVKKKWNKKRRIFETEELREQVLVADRLIPMDPLMTDQYQFYIPSGDIVDGFLMKNGRWQFKEGIEPRNPKQDNLK